MSKVVTRFSTMALAFMLPLASMSAVQATPAEFSPESVFTEELSEEQLAAAQKELSVLFTEVLTAESGKWTVNEDAAIKHGVSLEDAYSLAGALTEPTISTRHAVNTKEYRDCVINATGLGALVGAAGGGGSQIAYLIAVKNWKDLAYVIVKLVGVNAVRGGVAGLAVTLAGAGAWCAIPWAQ